ncbi:LysR family transcriptional regulator [Vibrio ishigakensis]|uniref:LysR family transcriptional regulator n=1 Tax=Vibrio ishigakensis TaxID=1481914 RepID=UPI0021C2C35E|nr:LysR family transcriptional regulator [Vibrio ishigakensis]
MKSTELNLIPFFVAVYEEESMSKAAQRLGVSQPAVSKALKRLREIYDDPLFHRSPVGVTPTSFAGDIYPALSTAFKNFSSTLSASRSFDPKVSKRIFSIACLAPIGYELMPKVLNQIKANAPGIDLEVHPLFTEDLESDLRLQRYDLVIDVMPKGRTTLQTSVIGKERLMVIARKDHPRVSGEITPEQFLAEEHIAVSQWRSRSTMMSSDNNDYLNKRKIVYRAPGVLEALAATCQSDYLALFPVSTFSSMADFHPVQSLDAPFLDVEKDLCMLWHPSRTSDASHRWLRNQVSAMAKTVFL